jgi:hypothetical protein
MNFLCTKASHCLAFLYSAAADNKKSLPAGFPGGTPSRRLHDLQFTAVAGGYYLRILIAA